MKAWVGPKSKVKLKRSGLLSRQKGVLRNCKWGWPKKGSKEQRRRLAGSDEKRRKGRWGDPTSIKEENSRKRGRIMGGTCGLRPEDNPVAKRGRIKGGKHLASGKFGREDELRKITNWGTKKME